MNKYRDYNYFLIIIPLVLLLKYSNFYPLLLLLATQFLFLKDNKFSLIKSYISIQDSLKKYKIFASLSLIISLSYAFKLFKFSDGAIIDVELLDPSIFFDFINISIFFLIILFWVLLLNNKIILVFSKGFYIFLIFCCIDLIIDFYTDYSFLRGHFSFNTRASSIMEQPQLGAYVLMLFSFCLAAYYKYKHEYNILFIWFITFVIILFTINRLPLIFHLIYLLIIITNTYKKEKNFKFLINYSYKYILLTILVTVYFFNVSHSQIKNFIKIEIIYPLSSKLFNNKSIDLVSEFTILSSTDKKDTKEDKKDTKKSQKEIKNLPISDQLFLVLNMKDINKVQKEIKNLPISDQLFLSLNRKALSDEFESVHYDVRKTEFYEIDRIQRGQTCRRLELLLLNSKFMIYGKNFFGVRQDKLTREWSEFRSEKCKHEKLKHPHSILFEMIHYFGIILFFSIIISYGIFLFFTQSYTTILILGILLSPSGIGSLTSSSFSILLSLVIGICVKQIDKKNE
jgi:hypothetical protein